MELVTLLVSKNLLLEVVEAFGDEEFPGEDDLAEEWGSCPQIFEMQCVDEEVGEHVLEVGSGV